ncbi:MAG: hypothetical protein OHK0035_06420 [Cyanobacteria bacterium J069]
MVDLLTLKALGLNFLVLNSVWVQSGFVLELFRIFNFRETTALSKSALLQHIFLRQPNLSNQVSLKALT